MIPAPGSLFALVFALFACSPKPANDDPSGAPRIWDYCDLAATNELPDCVQIPDPPPPQLEQIKLCCEAPDGYPCYETTSFTACSPDDYIALCEWGRSNLDGTITCFD